MLRAAKTIGLHQAWRSLEHPQPQIVQKRFAARNGKRGKKEIDRPDTEWLGHISGVTGVPQALPSRDKSPLPKLFTSEGLSLPKVEKPALKSPVTRKLRKGKKKKKVEKTQLERDAMLEEDFTDGSVEDAIKRIKASKVAAFGHTGGRTPKGTIEDARIETRKIIQKHKNEYETYLAKKEPGTYIPTMRDDDFAEVNTEDRLVEDDALKAQWEQVVESKKKRLTQERPSASSKARILKVKSNGSLKRKSTVKSKMSKMTKKTKGQKNTPMEADPSMVPGPFDTSFGGRKFVGTEDDLTFLEGSKEDLEFFGAELSEEPGDQAEKNTVVRPYLRKKLRDLQPKGDSLKSVTPEEYMDRIQASDDNATKKFIDTYDHDMISKPPTGVEYPATFKDSRGSSPAVLTGMGTWVSLKTRGIRFDGSDLLAWKVRDHLISQDVAQVKFDFHLPSVGTVDGTHYGPAGVVPQLDKFDLDFDFPVKLATQGEPNAEPTLQDAKIHFTASHDAKTDSFSIALIMPDGKTTIRPTSPSIDALGYPTSFDEQIRQIQLQLPAKTYLKSCWNCAFSEYSPIHKQTFGGLGCFRQWPNITNVRNPMELLRNWKKRIEDVQETHSCDSFKRRTKPRIDGLNPTRTSKPEGIKRREAEIQRTKDLANASQNKL